MKKRVIAVDFDGTLCVDRYPEIGEPITRTILYIKKCKELGDIVILWTCRQGEYLTAAVEWCKRQGIVFDYINENANHNVAQYGGDTRKIYADLYLDDKAVSPSGLPVFWTVDTMPTEIR